ncbi:MULTISPECIES: LPXTG cell wall anchor domain-containing protein [unclassified Micromonospora]|uniref:LPXTG cell wall anchor domain-containing protein n=1 Tax=unclassified Micromonospora TaxID=2617518 RepID=UPI002FF22C97
MLRHSIRRWLAGAAVAGAFLAATAIPATAAGGLRISARDLLVAPGHSAPGAVRVDFDGIPSSQGVPVTLDIDLSEWGTLGTFTVTDDGGWDCARRADTLHCLGAFGRWSRTPTLYFQLTARADAPLDGRAELSVRGSSSVGTATRKITVSVVEGVDLVTEPKTALRAAPGGTVELTSAVRNAGPVPVRGAVLTLDADMDVMSVDNFRNCRRQEARPTICRFDTELAPGVTYRLSAPLPLTLKPFLRSGLVLPNRLQWWTTDDWALVEQDPDVPLPPGTPGTGAELRLVAQGTAQQSDTAAWNSWTAVSITVTGERTADATAVGGRVSAEVGNRVTVTPGFRNLGPTTVEIWREIPLVRFRIPDGTTAVEVHWGCAPIGAGPWNPGDTYGQPGAREYGCSGPGDIAGVGETVSYPFTLRVDRLPQPSAGTVTIDVEADTNSANDRAEIVLVPPAGSGGNGGGDDSLPITGASTALTMAVGGLLLAAGTTGVLLARRRRADFVA